MLMYLFAQSQGGEILISNISAVSDETVDSTYEKHKTKM